MTAGIAAAIFCAVYLALDFNKLYALRYGSDLGTFLQTLVNLRSGSSWNYGEWRPHFQVHNSWALALLAPMVWCFPYAQTLIVIQVVAVAGAAIPLVAFARAAGLSRRAASAVAIAYLLSPATQGLAYDNFSENVFVPLIVFCGALAARRNLFWPTLLAAQMLMGLKEDEILFVAWFGVAAGVFWRRQYGVALIVLSLCNAALFWGLDLLHGVHPSDPSYGFAVHDISGKFTLVSLLLAPYAFSPTVLGWRLLLGFPLLAEIVFMQPWNYEASRIGSHYAAPLLAAVSLAAVFGLRQCPRLIPAVIPLAVIVPFLVFNDTMLRPGRWPYVVDWSAYTGAVTLRESSHGAIISRVNEGAWAVAAANPRIRLSNDYHERPHCPAYNTDAREFFTTLLGGTLPKLCGGVPIMSKSAL
jgi:uncharacterized membrane protein